MAPRKSNLHVVKATKAPGTKPPARRKGKVAIAAGGTRLELLKALRDRIAADIDDGVAARDLASLSKRLLDISDEIVELEVAEDGDEVSDAAAIPDEAWSS